MTDAPKKKTGRKSPGPKKPGAGYDVECVYQYIKSAGGSIEKAMKLALEAKDTRVPTTPKTWYEAAKRENMRERYKKETVEEWKQFHNEREAKKQHMLDRVAFAIEPLIEKYADILSVAVKAWVYLQENPITRYSTLEERKLALKYEKVRQSFGLSPEIFDRMVRLYCRAMGMPERITHSSHEVRNATVLTYADAEEQKKLSREGKITRPMVAESLQEANILMDSIDLGPEWEIAEDETLA